MEVKIKQGAGLVDATIEVVDGVMVVSPKEVKFEPKEGDVVTSVQNGVYEGTAIFEEEDNLEAWFHASISKSGKLYTSGYMGYVDDLRPATEEEKQKLFDKLKEEGYEWDAEKKELVKIKWEPNEGEEFWFPINKAGSICFKPLGTLFNKGRDEEYLHKGWVFKTKGECQEFCDKLNEAIEGFKP